MWIDSMVQQVARRGHRCELLKYFIAFALVNYLQSACQAVKSPLIYTKLRDDTDYLQLYRYYQQKPPHEERKEAKKLELIDTNELNETIKKEYVYYENHMLDISTLTYDDLIFEALDRTYRTRHVPSYMQSYDREEDRRKSSDKRLVSRTRCARELAYLVDNLPPQGGQVGGLQPDLRVFYDSFAREETGLLLGNYHWLGQYNQCSRRIIVEVDRRNQSNSLLFNGRYCTVALRSPTWDKKIEQKLASNYPPTFEFAHQPQAYKRFFRINVGICMPESCDSTAIDWAHDEVRQLAIHKLNLPFSSYKMVDLFCLPDETSELRQYDTSSRWFLLFITTWLIMVILATICDCRHKSLEDEKKPSGSLSTFVNCLSLKQNWFRFMSSRGLTRSEEKGAKKPEVGDLTFLDFFKVIFMPFVLWLHISLFNRHFNKLPLYSSSYTHPISFHPFAAGVFIVDWYFIMSGIILSYSMFARQQVDKLTTMGWLQSVVHRYWRLCPIYLIHFWYRRNVMKYHGVGPTWDYGSSNMTLTHFCEVESWWFPLTLTSNFNPTHMECLMPSWSISAEMQFFILSPFILIILYKSPARGWFLTLGLALVGCLLRFYRTYYDRNEKHFDMLRPRTHAFIHINRDMYDLYQYPQYRMSTYLLGLLAGHYIYMVLSGKWTSRLYNRKRPDKSNFLLRLTFLVGCFLCLVACFANSVTYLIPQEWEDQIKAHTSFAYGFNHTAAGFAMILVLVAFMLGCASRVRRFMELPIWTILVRLNYNILMNHVVFILTWCRQTDVVIDMEIGGQFMYLAIVMFLSYSAAFVTTILLELPLAELERNFNPLRGSSKRVEQIKVKRH